MSYTKLTGEGVYYQGGMIIMDAALKQTVEALQKLVKDDDQQQIRVAARRELWGQSTKETILDAFKEILGCYNPTGRPLFVDEGHLFQNFESVQLRFGSIATGIIKHTDNRRSVGIERGAVLVFGQSESGLIGVVRYPFCSDLPGEKAGGRDAWEHVRDYEPEEVTREFVMDQAKEFFGWAGPTSYGATPDLRNKRSIGFLPPPIE
jgi:hypothetical protein